MEKNGIYGSLAGFVAAVALQPLENIKMVMLVPPKQLPHTNNFLNQAVAATKYIYKDDGYRSFYRGLLPNVVRSACSSAFFFSTLRLCEKLTKRVQGLQTSKLAPFMCSLIARVTGCFFTNPLSILETRYEYGGSQRWRGGMLSNLVKIYQVEGLQGFWKGGLATCYKEGIFAGAYYSLYQEGKAIGLNAFISGMLAGVISTSLTHPFEIVRAQIQSQIFTQNATATKGITNQVQILFKSGQAFRGLAPRLVKKPLTNTLAFLVFETMQKMQPQH